MAMTLDPQQRQLAAVGFDHVSYPGPGNQFAGSWPSSSSPHSAHIFPSALGSSNTTLEALARHQIARSGNVPSPFTSIPTSTSSVGSHGGYGTYGHQDLMGLPPTSFSNPLRSTYDHAYSAAPVSSEEAYAPVPAPYLSAYGRISSQQQPQSHTRRSSQQSTSSLSHSQSSFGDQIDSGRGLGAMSQDLTTPKDLTTPRNIYGPRGDREPVDSYGFPASHSSHSSISSASQYPSYYNSSVDSSSVSDYGSQSDSVEPINSRTRTLPPPTCLINASLPPAPPPSSMMGQFNSKVSPSSQKKHRCKVCDKRFTRPSSLQTHMYSHTGEKPYACEADGCGRHFSVVSNLRRHRKVHRCDQSPDKDSPEGSWISEKSSSSTNL